MQYLTRTEPTNSLKVGDVVAIFPDSHIFGGRDLIGSRVVSLPESHEHLLWSAEVSVEVTGTLDTIETKELSYRAYYLDENDLIKKR